MEKIVFMGKFKIIIFLFFIGITMVANCQEEKVYNPEANAEKEIKIAIETAKKENKHVFLQIGGNWCPWCLKFHSFVDNDSELKTILEKNYEVVNVNYDRKNHSHELFEYLGFPQRFGFPVFVILDENGKRIHTQNSALLEEGKGYNKNKILRFFKNWSPAALNPASYKE